MAFRAEQLRRQPVAAIQAYSRRRVGKEDGYARHQQRFRQPVHDRAEQPVQIGLRAQAAAEGDQGLAIVVALAVEDPVYPVLNGAFERFEKLGGDDDGSDQAPRSRAGQAGVHHLSRDRDRTKVKADQGSRRQGVGDAALENQVDVHQAVADDGPAKGQGQKDQANAPQPDQNAGNRNAGEKRDDVQHREGNDGEQSSPGQPLQLLAAKRVLLPHVVAEEDQGSQRHSRAPGSPWRAGRDACLSSSVACPLPHGHHLQRDHGQAGKVDEGVDPVAARGRPLLWKRQRKVQKERRLQRLGQDPAPVDGPVKGVEFARVVERIKDKRGQAKDVKVSRPGSRPPPEEDIEADGKVNQRNEPQALVLAAVGGLKKTDAWMGTPDRTSR